MSIKIDNDNAPEVAEADLVCNFLHRLEVRFENRVLETFLADEFAGIYIDDGHCFGLIDNDIAARLQPHPPSERARDVELYAECVEDRFPASITAQYAQAVSERRGRQIP